MKKHISLPPRHLVCLVILLLATGLPVQGISGDHPILFISSYNPDAQRTLDNINEFQEEYKRLGGTSHYVIESLNCKSFQDSPQWKHTMQGILKKYTGTRTPKMLILLGQEARAAYLAQEDELRRDLPVIYALCSRNSIDLPTDNVLLAEWMPHSTDMLTEYTSSVPQGAIYYNYDIRGNVELVRSFFPEIRHLALVTDNSYGGVALQALIRREVASYYPDMDLILLDGRVHTLHTLAGSIRTLPAHTALLLGTWRVDMNDEYFLSGATASLEDVNPAVPVFTVTSAGMGNWSIGGIVPEYDSQGKDIACKIFAIENGEGTTEELITLVDNRTMLDSRQLSRWELSPSLYGSGDIDLINKQPSFYTLYKYQIWLIVIACLAAVTGMCILLFFFLRMRRLKNELEVSEKKLRRAKEQAEESNRLKSAFLANMSHEIRTPLNSIVGFSNILAATDCTKEEQQGYFEIINTNSELLLRLINDILDVSRLEADKILFNFEKQDVVQICRQVLATVSYSRQSNNEFILDTSCKQLFIRTDNQRLQQVLINLLSNAAKFTNKGKITLSLEVDKKSKKVIFSVTDTGCGIPLEKQKQVFERFEKLDDYVQGTGLGLAICRLITQKWGGKIWIDPEYTTGARFVFTHPIGF